MTTKRRPPTRLASEADASIPPPIVLRFGPSLRMTDRRFDQLCAENPDLRLERTAEGDLVVMPPAHSYTGHLELYLGIALGSWGLADNSGIPFGPSAGFTLPNGAIRAPDASWVLRSRWDGLPEQERLHEFAHICPDFVLELRSESDRLADVQDKMREYIDNGAQLGWLIDPVEKAVWVYRPGASPERLNRPKAISGDPLLPGFVLDLAPVWGS